MVYIYAARHVKDFWEAPELKTLYGLCDVIEAPHQRFATNLRMVQPSFLISSGYTYVFILLDDVKLKSDFDMISFLSIMQRNNLTAASPRIEGAYSGGGQRFREIMQAKPKQGTIGIRTSFLEFFACIMTIPSYTSLWKLLFPSINPYGWGYDLWYNCVAKQDNPHHAMGIISIYTAVHDQDLTKTERTDNASAATKWKALLQQEKFYARHYRISLSKCRKMLADVKGPQRSNGKYLALYR